MSDETEQPDVADGSASREADSEKERSVLDAGMQWERYQRYPYLLAKLVFYGLLVAGVGWILFEMSAVVFPVFMSLLLAYLLNPAVNVLERRRVPRPLGIVAILLGLGLFIVVFAIVLYPTMAEQVRKVGRRAPEAWEMLETRFFPWLTETLGLEIPETFEEAFEQYGQQIEEAVPAIADQIGDWVGRFVTQTQILLVSLFNLVMIPIFTVYFLYDFERGKQKLRQIVPEARREVLLDRIERMDRAVGQWFRGQIEVSVILAVLYAIGLGAVYGISGHGLQAGIVIGLLTGFLNVIPYLGFAVGSIVAFLVVLIEWRGWFPLIGVATAFTVIQLAESYYITPRVMGDKVGMKPIAVIIVLLIGGHAAGLLGIVLAIPIAGAVKVLFPDILRWYKNSSFYTGVPTVPAGAAKGGGGADEPQEDPELEEGVDVESRGDGGRGEDSQDDVGVDGEDVEPEPDDTGTDAGGKDESGGEDDRDETDRESGDKPRGDVGEEE